MTDTTILKLHTDTFFQRLIDLVRPSKTINVNDQTIYARQVWNALMLECVTPDQLTTLRNSHNDLLTPLITWSDLAKSSDFREWFLEDSPESVLKRYKNASRFKFVQHSKLHENFSLEMFPKMIFPYDVEIYSDLSPLKLIGWISLQSLRLDRRPNREKIVSQRDESYFKFLLERVCVYGDLNIHGDPFITKGETHLSINKSKIEGKTEIDEWLSLNAELRHTTFKQSANMARLDFHGRTSIEDCTFHDTLDLTDTYFPEPTNLRGTKFTKRFPTLDGALLHPKTDFTAENSHWPNSINKDHAKDAAKSCAIIRHNVAAQGLVEEAHFFYRKEMDARKMQANFVERWFFQYYWSVSNYGQSITLPTVQLLCILIGGWLILYCPLWSEVSWTNALAMSFANTFKFLGIERIFLDRDLYASLPWYLKAASAVQMVYGVIAIFLLGLGIRNRFRLK